MEEIYVREGMDVYQAAAALAAKRAAAEVGKPYQAGRMDIDLYRWDGSEPCGGLEHGAEMENEHHEGLQVYAEEAWHPVTGFGNHTMDAQAAEKHPVELALKDSSVYLLEAGAHMAHEGKRLCQKLREMLNREDSDAEYMALDVEQVLDRLNCIMTMVQEQEGVVEI